MDTLSCSYFSLNYRYEGMWNFHKTHKIMSLSTKVYRTYVYDHLGSHIVLVINYVNLIIFIGQYY